jgi:hypothetical protein
MNDTIDLCIVSTLRSEILSRTLDSFKKHIKYSGQFNIIANIDLVPVSDVKTAKVELFKLMSVFEEFSDDKFYLLENYMFNATGNFANAVRKLWFSTTSKFVFHLEDDWEFISDINIDELIWSMDDNLQKSDYCRFPKINAPHIRCLKKPALQPSLWRGDVVRALSREIGIDKDPEKQLRIGSYNSGIDNILKKMSIGGFLDYSTSACCKDIGREWRDKKRLSKWSAKEPEKDTEKERVKNITWGKIV